MSKFHTKIPKLRIHGNNEIRHFTKAKVILKNDSIFQEEYLKKIVYLVEAFDKLTADQLAKVSMFNL